MKEKWCQEGSVSLPASPPSLERVAEEAEEAPDKTSIKCEWLRVLQMLQLSEVKGLLAFDCLVQVHFELLNSWEFSQMFGTNTP